jgi:hypothetical protein
VRAASKIFRATLSIVLQVFTDAEAHGFAIQYGTHAAHIKQAPFKSMSQG